MTPTVVLPVLIGGLYAAGVYLLLDRSLTRVLLGFLLLGNATNLLLLSSGGPAGDPPLLGEGGTGSEGISDPLPQALVLTAIVITFGVSAFLLALIHRSWRLVRLEVVEDDAEDRRVAARRAGDVHPDDLDPEDLAPEDRPAGHDDRRRRGRSISGYEVDRQFEQRYAGTPSDDVDLPATRRRRR